MSTAIIVGNIFSLLSAICLAISVIKKNKNDLILWQIWCIILANFACFALKAYAALITGIVDLVRNYLAYKEKLSAKRTTLLVILCIIIGILINNLGIIGILAIIASTSYTIFMYTTKDEQQMRWALVLNQVLWLIHDTYIQAYPAALTDAVIAVWTAIQITKYILNKKAKTHKLTVKEKYYNMLKLKTKTIELRLFDKKRQMIKIGDTIEFLNKSDSSDTFSATVIALHKAENFAALCQKINCQNAGFANKQELVSALEEFYTKDKQQENGVIGIEIQKI